MTKLPHKRSGGAPLLALSASLAIGILCARVIPINSKLIVLGAVLTIITATVTVCLMGRERWAKASAFVLLFFALAGVALYRVEQRPVAAHRIKQMLDAGVLDSTQGVEVTGTVQGQLEPIEESFYLKLKCQSIRTNKIERTTSGTILLLLQVNESGLKNEYRTLELRHGANLRVLAQLDREDKYRNPGSWRFTEYLDQKGYDATGVVKSPLLIERLDDDRVFLPLAWLYDWRARLQDEFARRFSAETAGVLNAALLGNPYNIPDGAAQRFREGGTFHVLVISGFQIAFIGGLVLVLVRWFTRRRFIQFAFSAFILWAYAVAVGGEASVLRSAFMFTLVVLAPVVSRRASALNGLGAAALALLVATPSDLFDPSFQLTFLSVLAIVTMAVPLLERAREVGAWRPTHETPYPPAAPRWFRTVSEALFWSELEWRREIENSNIKYKLFKTPLAVVAARWRVQAVLRFAISAIVVSASVQIAMLPVLIIYFHRVSLASLVLNIFVGVAMAALALLALAAVIVVQISPWAAAPLVWLVERTDWLMIRSVDPFTHLGLASFRLPHYHGWLYAIYVLYFALLTYLITAFARWQPMRPEFITRRRSLCFSALPVRLVAIGFAAVLVVTILHPYAVARPDGKLHVDFLDVGQGDCALVTTPDGTTLLIDGGGQPSRDWAPADDAGEAGLIERDAPSIGERVVSEFLWARGLDTVDYILPTHLDADHLEGLNDIARNFRIRSAILGRTPVEDQRYVRFAVNLKTLSVPIARVGAGDILRAGEVSVEVLWPQPVAGGNGSYGNNDGLVLRLRYRDRSFLFAADIERSTEAALLRSGANLQSDVVKVPHHGSRTSSTDPFVAAARPSLAVISVGRRSIFGHPHYEVVDRWRATGADVLTTGERGTISVTCDGKRLMVTSFVD